MQLPSPVRLLGIDLGITSDHTAVVIDDAGGICARRRARSTVASLAALEAAALATAELGTQLVVVVEPTGSAWLPVAVFFGRRGHTVLRVTSAKAADLRRCLARHAKSNSIDAESLARLPLVAPTGLTAVEFGSPARASLDRRVRAVARLTAEIGRRKTRIRALAHQLVPTIGAALSDDGLNQTDLAVLERYADPRALLAAGPARLIRLIATTSRGQLGQAKAQALRTAAGEAAALWEGDSAIAIGDLAAEVASEVRLVRSAEVERARHEHARDAALACADPAGLASSLPGLGPVGTAQLVATMGRPGRFPNGGAFKAFTGLTPRASETGQTDRKHQPMTKAGPGRYAASSSVRQHRPQARPPARRGLPRPDDRAWRDPPQGAVRGRRPAGRAGLAHHGPRPAVCHLRPPGAAGHPRTGQADDRRALHRHRRSPPAVALQQESGEGPSHGAQGATQVTARSWTQGDLPRASLTTPPRIVNQATRPT
jgi:transposase